MVFSPANNWTSCPPAFVVNNGSKTKEGSWLMQHDSIDIILIPMTIIWNYDYLQRFMSFPFCELACSKISWWTQIHLSVAEEKTSQRKRKQDILHMQKELQTNKLDWGISWNFHICFTGMLFSNISSNFASWASIWQTLWSPTSHFLSNPRPQNHGAKHGPAAVDDFTVPKES